MTRLDATGHPVSLGVGEGELLPRVRQTLLDSERDAPALLVDIQDHHLRLVADLDDARRMDVAVGPIHFRDVDQTFDAFLDLHERAEVRDVGHPAGDAAALRVPLGDAHPGVFAELLEPERNAVPLPVVLEDLDLDLVTDVDHLRGMADPPPRHVG